MGQLDYKGTSRWLALALCAMTGGLLQAPAMADDTEIYQATLSASGDARPKVLLLVDDSGSMGAVAQEGGEKPPYDPNATYVDAGFDDTKIYWSTSNSKPSIGTNNYFSANKNRCESSFVPLANEGNMTTKAKRWRPASGSFQSVTEWVCNGSRYWYWCLPDPPGWEQQTSNEWVGDEAEWLSLSSSDRDPTHVECQADVLGSEPGNGPSLADGYPVQPVAPDAADADAYTGSLASSNISWGGTTYNWYTAHYLNYWYDESIVSVEKTRLEVVQEVINELIDSNPSIDFGVAVFNDNSDGNAQYYYCGPYVCSTYNNEDDHGGRIVARIKEDMTLADRALLTSSSGLVNGLVASGSTPLCESAYEAYRYLAGDTPVYGLKRDTQTGSWSAGKDGTLDTPVHDSSAIDGSGSYISPTTDCAYTYVILLTDGFPTLDTHANAAIESLTGETCADYPSDETIGGVRQDRKNCLPNLTNYMANNDLNPDRAGDQFGITYTIGFATDQELLEDAALNGKGEYFTAEDTASLAAAFEGAVFSILSSESSFTSPSVAVNTFTRTQSRNEVFFAMFKPDASKDWPGNIKRLDIKKVTIDGEEQSKLVDADEALAINENTGLIKDSARTAWSSGTDGPTVNEGGVGALLAQTDPDTRVSRLKTNSGTNGALETFNATNLTADAYGLDVLFPGNPVGALHQLWGVNNQIELEESIKWGHGRDTEDLDDDFNVGEARDWVMGDILHSRPRVISYGALGSFTRDNPDLRILVGTNSGFLHMFGNSDGVEDWAFFPKELGPILTQRRKNETDSGRPYGIDSPPVVYSKDVNRDGTLNHADGDKVWVFFGLRRGGRNIYALDISNPDSPSFLWMIDPSTAGFSEIGQTWSIPKVAFVPGHVDGSGKPKPVLIFGAGYDTAKDAHSSLGDDNDTLGRGVYIVDAETGALVWSVTPADNSATNMQAAALEHSVPAPVATLDSNGDDLTDRIYFGDTAGILWRIDMPGNALPTSSQDTWRLTKVFSALDTGEARTHANDRRFFNQPDVVRVEFGDQAADAVLIGTGDRTNPAAVDDSNGTGVPAPENAFYMILDQAISPYSTDHDCDTDPSDFRCALPLHPSDLYDATDNALQQAYEDYEASDKPADLAEYEALKAQLLASNGWQIRLERDGEKSLSKSVTVQGKVFFGTFTPGVGQANMCEPAPGEGRLYAVDLYDGSEALDYFNSRFITIGDQIPDTPAIHVSGDGDITIIPPQGGQGTGDGDLIDTEASIPAPYGSYWYREEY